MIEFFCSHNTTMKDAASLFDAPELAGGVYAGVNRPVNSMRACVIYQQARNRSITPRCLISLSSQGMPSVIYDLVLFFVMRSKKRRNSSHLLVSSTTRVQHMKLNSKVSRPVYWSMTTNSQHVHMNAVNQISEEQMAKASKWESCLTARPSAAFWHDLAEVQRAEVSKFEPVVSPFIQSTRFQEEFRSQLVYAYVTETRKARLTGGWRGG